MENNYYDDERLFSTGDPELDDILEEVYYSGIEEGYECFQKEFNKHKLNQRRRATDAAIQATHQASKGTKHGTDLERYATEINTKFGGDIDKWVQSHEPLKNGSYGKLKGKFGEKGGLRAALEEAVAGTPVAEIDQVAKHLKSAEIQAERGADQVVNYGKTRQSVQTAKGNTFDQGGKKVTVSAHTGGDTKTHINDARNQHEIKVLSKENKRRANVVNREVAYPGGGPGANDVQNGLKVGANTGKQRIRTRKKNPDAVASGRTTPGTTTEIYQATPNKTMNSAIDSAQGKVNSTIQEHPRKKPEAARTRTLTENTKAVTDKAITAGAKNVKGKNWLQRNKTGLIIAGTGLAAAGAAAGIYKHNKNKSNKDNSDMEVRRKVYSLLQDEFGEERYYSTNEFEMDYDWETGEKFFSEKSDEKKGMSKGGKIALGAAGTVAATVAALEGANYIKKGVSYKQALKKANMSAQEIAAMARKANGSHADTLVRLSDEKRKALEKIAGGYRGEGIAFVEKANKRAGDAGRWAGTKAVQEYRAAGARRLSRQTNRVADNARKSVAKEQRRAAKEVWS